MEFRLIAFPARARKRGCVVISDLKWHLAIGSQGSDFTVADTTSNRLIVREVEIVCCLLLVALSPKVLSVEDRLR